MNNPTVLLTRPTYGSTQFMEALRDLAGPFVPVVSPAFQLVAVPAEIPEFDAAIFTSRAGVAFAPAGKGRVAWCVGDATAQDANDAGYDARSANGDAADLIALILAQAGQDSLLHVRGEIVRENISAAVRRAGMQCDEVVVYRKEPLALEASVAKQIGDASDLIIPAFSGETVSIITGWHVDLSQAVVVAISETVADVAQQAGALSVHVSERPDLEHMVAQTARLIA